MKFSSSMLHREFTDWALLDSSPDEYFLKKLTGRERIRIMTEASTASDVFVLMRSMRRLLTILSIWDANAADTKNAIIPISTEACLFIRIFPVTREYTFGSIVPTRVTTNVASAICRKSLLDILFFM